MSLAKMRTGDGVEYMLRNIARGDGAGQPGLSLAAYYTASGYPPGIWLGTGLAGLNANRGITPGSVVTEEAMRLLFNEGRDPATGIPLGRTGTKPKNGKTKTVAGFDLTFSPPKSVSVLWGLADPEVKAVIERAHREAITAVIGVLERDVARTRIGAGGAVQVPVVGVIAAAFDHFDSRDGDPQLHTHVTVANKVQARDLVWRSLYGSRLYAAAVALSETYDALLADALTRRLGLAWQWRDRGPGRNPARELAIIPDELITEFSGRATAINAVKDRAIARFIAKHGRAPTDVEVIKIRQTATLSTRGGKHIKSLARHTVEWRERAGRILGRDARYWVTRQMRTARVRPRLATAGRVGPADVEVLAAAVLTAVEAKRSVWSRWNLQAEAARQIATTNTHFATPDDLLRVQAHVTQAAVDRSVLLNPDTQLPEKARGIAGAELSIPQSFTSLTILEAENRLLTAAADTTGPIAETLSADTTSKDPVVADSGQRQAVASIVSSGRVVDVLVGPAGAGKSTTMRHLADTWSATYGPGSVTGLAPSSAAAKVLGGEISAVAETTAQWIAQQAAQPGRLDQLRHLQQLRDDAAAYGVDTGEFDDRIAAVRGEFDRWSMKPGQLVIIDEAGMTDTPTLDAIATQARDSGAKVLLVGDPAQLSAVGAGGAFAMLTNTRPDAPTLETVRRFINPDRTLNTDEAEASIQLRGGNPQAVGYYRTHGRIHTLPPGADPLDGPYRAWAADRARGLASLLIAVDNDTVTALNQRAHHDLVTRGVVKPGGVHLADGTQAGIGDVIVTRKINRRIPDGSTKYPRRTPRGVLTGGFITNGATFTVTGHTAEGDLIVTSERGAVTRLPADYVAKHVQLGYATTAHRAQGATVDTTHVIATPGMSREAFYVAMTRGRHANHAHINATDHGDIDTLHNQPGQSAGDVIARILSNTGAALSAHDTREHLARLTATLQARATAEATPENTRPVDRAPTPASRRPPAAALPGPPAASRQSLHPLYPQPAARRPEPPNFYR